MHLQIMCQFLCDSQWTSPCLEHPAKASFPQRHKVAASGKRNHVHPPSYPGGPVATEVWCLTFIRRPCPTLVCRKVWIGSGLGYRNKSVSGRKLYWSALPNQHSFLSQVWWGQALQTAKLFYKENEVKKMMGW